MGCEIGYRNDESYKVVCFYYPKRNVYEKYQENVLVGNNTIKEEVKTDPVEHEYNNYEDFITNKSCFISKFNYEN